MELTEEQKQQVSTWTSEGLGLSEIQARISDEFDIAMTYMDVRFLVDDLNLELKDQAPAPDKDITKHPSPASGLDPAGGASPGGGVSIDVDRVQRPGAVMSGSATFRDGKSANWQIDQMGRLGIIPGEDGHKPSEEDIMEFQEALQAELQQKGM